MHKKIFEINSSQTITWSEMGKQNKLKRSIVILSAKFRIVARANSFRLQTGQ